MSILGVHTAEMGEVGHKHVSRHDLQTNLQSRFQKEPCWAKFCRQMFKEKGAQTGWTSCKREIGQSQTIKIMKKRSRCLKKQDWLHKEHKKNTYRKWKEGQIDKNDYKE